MPSNEYRWWMDGQNVSMRFVMEVQAMNKAYPKLFKLPAYLKEPGNMTPPKWTANIRLNVTGIPEAELTHTIRIMYPREYPSAAPQAYCDTMGAWRDAQGRPVAGVPHHLGQGKMCLFNWNDSVNHGWNPAKSTATTVASWAIEWLYACLLWSKTKEWPGLEHVQLGHRERNLSQRRDGSGQAVVRSGNLDRFRQLQDQGVFNVVPAATDEPEQSGDEPELPGSI